MRIGVPTEQFPGEHRVALVPASIAPLKKAGFDVVIERGAGDRAGFPDTAYQEKGAHIFASRGEVFTTDIVLHVRAGEFASMRQGQVVIAMADPLGAPETVREIAARGVTAFALELIPRITRAQSMDVLSSMATIAGYKAVLLAAGTLPRMFPLLTTAAGTVTPAHVFIVGVGVAGLQAIATARKLGAVVEAYDVRPAVKEQVQSVGANVVVITTAVVPGKKAPVLVTTDMVRGMAPGSVIVDLAAERGGNCELTRADQVVVEQGVTILGPTNLPSTVPYHASQMYAKNITTFLLHLVRDGAMKLDPADEITRDTLIAQAGDVVNARVRQALGLPELVASS